MSKLRITSSEDSTPNLLLIILDAHVQMWHPNHPFLNKQLKSKVLRVLRRKNLWRSDLTHEDHTWQI